MPPLPKPDAQRRRRNKQPERTEVVEAVEPVPLTLEGEHRPETVAWWADWCTAPQAQAFTVTDWRRLRMLVPLVDKFHERPTHYLMSEIRQNESLLGATLVDRLRLRMDVKSPEEKPSEARPAPRRRLKVV